MLMVAPTAPRSRWLLLPAGGNLTLNVRYLQGSASGRRREDRVMPDGTYYDRELETMPWQAVQRATFAGLQRQVERVYSLSPHYRRVLDEAGVQPADIRHPDDLARIPF